ncbi:ABC transporter substrate-binding protein [Actinomycetes bacterium KLBMP 9759]
MKHVFAALAVAALLVLGACAGPPATAPATDRPGCITGFDPAADYFPVKAELAHARNVTLTYQRSYQVLTVRQPFPGGAPESYVLLRCGAPMPHLPPELAAAPVVETPVRSLYSESTTQLPMIVEIGALDVLTGVAAPEFVSGAEVRAKIAAGGVAAFAPDAQINTEAVVTAKPDVLLSQGADNPAFPALRGAGVPVIGWAEYLESSPLGQAEWIKIMGALTGREVDAARVFSGIEQRYAATAAKAATVPPTPVLIGSLFQGTWSVPTGGGTAGVLFRDAGATWSERDNPAVGSVPKDFETVFATDGGARTWLTDGPLPTRAAAVAADPRYADLTAVRTGAIWTRDKLKGPTGGNDVFERGVTHPDELLADLVAVLHPELVPGHQFVYYQQASG